VTFLTDTHILLWWVMDDPALPSKARHLLSDASNIPLVSPINFWEISIKRSLGKLNFRGSCDDILRAGPFHPLALTPEQAWLAGSLPQHHKDPFDRMLIAQAQTEGLELLTHDRRLKPYGACIHLV